MIARRIFFDMVLAFALMFAPWWFFAGIAVFGSIVFARYYELVLVGVLFDLLYGSVSGIWFFGFEAVGAAFSLVTFCLVEWIKREWRS